VILANDQRQCMTLVCQCANEIHLECNALFHGPLPTIIRKEKNCWA